MLYGIRRLQNRNTPEKGDLLTDYRAHGRGGACGRPRAEPTAPTGVQSCVSNVGALGVEVGQYLGHRAACDWIGEAPATEKVVQATGADWFLQAAERGHALPGCDSRRLLVVVCRDGGQRGVVLYEAAQLTPEQGAATASRPRSGDITSSPGFVVEVADGAHAFDGMVDGGRGEGTGEERPEFALRALAARQRLQGPPYGKEALTLGNDLRPIVGGHLKAAVEVVEEDRVYGELDRLIATVERDGGDRLLDLQVRDERAHGEYLAPIALGVDRQLDRLLDLGVLTLAGGGRAAEGGLGGCRFPDASLDLLAHL